MKKSIKKEYWHKQMFVIYLDLFQIDIAVCINMSEMEIKRWLKKISGKNYADFNECLLDEWDISKTKKGSMISFLGGVIILLKFEKNNFRKSVSLLSHEISHAVFAIFTNKETPLIKDTDEIYAYTHEFIMLQILSKLY